MLLHLSGRSQTFNPTSSSKQDIEMKTTQLKVFLIFTMLTRYSYMHSYMDFHGDDNFTCSTHPHSPLGVIIIVSVMQSLL